MIDKCDWDEFCWFGKFVIVVFAVSLFSIVLSGIVLKVLGI
jgi:hypothetical protein